MRRLGTLAGVTVAFVAAVALVAVVTPQAFAWDVAKSTNGVILVREPTDTTTTVSVAVYYDHKGDANTYPYGATSSYRSSFTYTNALYPSTDAYEVDLMPGYDRQLVLYGGRGTTVRFEPLDVTVENTIAVPVRLPATQSVNATVTDIPAIALESSVSVDGTLPVDWSFGSLGTDGFTASVFLAIAGLGGVVGYAGVRHLV